MYGKLHIFTLLSQLQSYLSNYSCGLGYGKSVSWHDNNFLRVTKGFGGASCIDLGVDSALDNLLGVYQKSYEVAVLISTKVIG